MLFIDDDYPALLLILRQVLGDDVACRDLNTTGYADVLWVSPHGTFQVEIKGQGEALGSLDALEAQLLRQLPMCDHHALLIYGITTGKDNGECATWKKGATKNGNGAVFFRHHDFHQNYLGYRAKLARFVEHGVMVYEVPTLEDVATQLVALYRNSQHEGSTFKRLIKEKFALSEEDQAKRKLALTLMGIEGAGFGEELALATTDLLADGEWDVSLAGLVHVLKFDPEAIQIQPLRSGKRTIGPAAVKRLKEALGI